MAAKANSWTEKITQAIKESMPGAVAAELQAFIVEAANDKDKLTALAKSFETMEAQEKALRVELAGVNAKLDEKTRELADWQERIEECKRIEEAQYERAADQKVAIAEIKREAAVESRDVIYQLVDKMIGAGAFTGSGTSNK